MVHAIRKKGLINFHSVKMYRGQNNMSAVLSSAAERTFEDSKGRRK